MIDLIVAASALAGALFTLIAAIGVLRMPDLFLRTAAASKASTFGLGLILLATSLTFQSLETTTKVIAVISFVLLTGPIAAHMITRAGYMDNVTLWDGTVVNEMGKGGTDRGGSGEQTDGGTVPPSGSEHRHSTPPGV